MKLKVYHGIKNNDFENFNKLFLFNRVKLSHFLLKKIFYFNKSLFNKRMVNQMKMILLGNMNLITHPFKISIL